ELQLGRRGELLGLCPGLAVSGLELELCPILQAREEPHDAFGCWLKARHAALSSATIFSRTRFNCRDGCVCSIAAATSSVSRPPPHFESLARTELDQTAFAQAPRGRRDVG